MKLKILLLTVLLLVISGCGIKKETEKPLIVTTLFPQYDFAKQIVGDKMDVTLLLKPGMESHSYDLNPKDMLKITGASLFIYTGKYMEGWVENVIDSVTTTNILDLSKDISFITHDKLPDPHIWTSIKNAKIMVNNILTEVIKIDPENKDYYIANAKNYIEQLDALDKSYTEVLKKVELKKIVFADKFAFAYLFNDYGLEHISAYDSCSSEGEPSAKAITKIIDVIKEEKIPVIYHLEMSASSVIDTIQKATKVKVLILHSAHNVTTSDLDKGITYVSIMKQNLENLKEGLQYETNRS